MQKHPEQFLHIGLRVPLSITYPPICRGGFHSREVVTSADILPNILDIVGAPIPAGLDGISFKEALAGGSLPERPVFWHYPHYGRAGVLPPRSGRASGS